MKIPGCGSPNLCKVNEVKNHKTRDEMLKLSIVPIEGMHSHEICRDVDRVAWEVYFLDWVKQFWDTSSVVCLRISGCFGL